MIREYYENLPPVNKVEPGDILNFEDSNGKVIEENLIAEHIFEGLCFPKKMRVLASKDGKYLNNLPKPTGKVIFLTSKGYDLDHVRIVKKGVEY